MGTELTHRRVSSQSQVTTIQPPASQTQITALPPELIELIFGFLDVKDIPYVSRVCHEWQRLASSDQLWKAWFKREFFSDIGENPKTHYQMTCGYLRNLTQGIYTTKKSPIHFNTMNGNPVVNVIGDKFIDCNAAGKIHVSDLQSGALLSELTDDAEGFEMFAPTETDQILTASVTGTIKIWDPSNGQCLKTFLGSGSTVESNSIIRSNVLITGYSNGDIRVWDYEKQKCLLPLSEHKRRINCLLLAEDQTLISASSDGSIKFWDLKDGTIAFTLEEGSIKVTSLLLVNPKKLIAGYKNGTIKFWNLETRRCQTSVKAHGDAPELCLSSNQKLISKGSVGPIKVWNVVSETCDFIVNPEVQGQYLTLFEAPHRKLVVGDSDGNVSTWNLESGQCEQCFTLKQRNLFLLFTDREQLIAGDPFGRILVLDPNVAHRDVFQELAGQLEEAIQSLDIECVLERFKRMPKVAKRQIYTFYEHLLKSKGLSYSGSVKDAFYDSNGLSFNPKLKARAIYLYLEQLNHNENLQHGQYNRYQ